MSITNIFEIDSLTISSRGFELLRKEIIENVELQKAKKMLMRFGYQLGAAKAEQLKATQSPQQLIASLPDIHATLKHVSKADLFDSSLSFHPSELSPDDIWGSWHDSIEVTMQLESHGFSSECSCYTLCGFTSGYLTVALQTNIYVYEKTCRAKGDEYCTFGIQTAEECAKIDIDSTLYDSAAAIEALPITYEQLYEQKVALEKAANYHNKLTEAILQQKDLQSILQIAYTSLNIPIYLTNSRGQHMYSCGLSAEQLLTLNSNTRYFMKINKSSFAKIQALSVISLPIYLADEIYATASFVYVDTPPIDEHHLFLERFSMVASLYFLNDKIRFETTERLKISFLDRLINRQFINEGEMLRHSQYIKPTLKAPYRVISIHSQTSMQQEKETDLYNQIFQLSHLLNFYRIHSLTSLKDNHFIVLIYNVADDGALLNDVTKILKELQKSNAGLQFKAGISDCFQELQDFDLYIKQAEQAMYFPRQQTVIHYSELSLLGAIIGQVDYQTLKNIATEELGELLSKEDKNQELLYTLYIYLKNNGRLEKTMHDLSLSIGGIKYRIHKIEKILRKDLKDALVTSYILLLIESLLTLNEIRFN